jgi:hypothetical protein
MAEALGMTSNAVRVALSRSRVGLRDCINLQLKEPTGDMKMEKKQRELDDLLNKYLDGNLSEVDARALSTQIEESPEVRKRYWELASIHGMVEQSIQSASLQATTGRESAEPERRTRVSGLSRIKTGIAGLGNWCIQCFRCLGI